MSAIKEKIKESIIENTKILFRKTIDKASLEEIYEAVACTVKDLIIDKWIKSQEDYDENDVKIVYYLSMEFLMGRFLGNNLLNLDMYDACKEALLELDVSMNWIEEKEPDPGLGNGGLGRLAACFLDSLTTLSYPACGCGIRYKYGIFKQKIVDGYQHEVPDDWLLKGNPWAIKRRDQAVIVKFGGSVRAVLEKKQKIKFIHEHFQSVLAIPYDYPIVGYQNNNINTLRLWDAESADQFDLKSFNEGNYAKAAEAQFLANTLTQVLYPADDHIKGKELRLSQQYFFISASLQRIVLRFKSYGHDFSIFPEKVQLQLNDTHPSIAVAELMRILMDDHDLEWDEAWDITQKTCAYTNHTIMQEALETWPIELFSRLLPRIYQIIEEINKRFCEFLQSFNGHFDTIRQTAIIADGQIKMAHLAIVGSHSVNGVAKIHTDILKTKTLKHFYDLYPEKFNNKTNGISQRRWLVYANPLLTNLYKQAIGDGFIRDLSQLEKLLLYRKDAAFQEEFSKIKLKNKISLSNYLLSEHPFVDPQAIFDIQIKRLHEYKRQLLNILHVIHLYNELKNNPLAEFTPRCFMFGAKAAASYHRAKMIIKLIHNVAHVVNNDPIAKGKLSIVFIENYNVSLAEKLIPAADVSEQISTASKEASGTGNMKFMLNGALTIGTMDGANIEIFEEVGPDNIFVFGRSASEILSLEEENHYNPWDHYNINQHLRLALTELINGNLTKGEGDIFREIYHGLLDGESGQAPDPYFILEDFESYRQAQKKLVNYYNKKDKWLESAIINSAKSGRFSSDRSISEYASSIWKLNTHPVKISEGKKS